MSRRRSHRIPPLHVSPSVRRRRRTPDLTLITLEHLDRAAEFSDDAELQDPVWLVRELKRHPNYMAVIEEKLTPAPPADDLPVPPRKKAGRPRLAGSWPLVFLAYVASRDPAMESFHQRWASSDLWAAAGFDGVPSYETLRSRFVELERLELERRERGEKTAFKTASDLLVRQARRHEPRIGRFFHVDGTGWQTHAKLEHCCVDRDACRAARRRSAMNLERLTDVELHEERHAEAAKPPDQLLTADTVPVILGEDDKYRYLMLGGHRYRTLDKTVGARMYGGKRRRKKKFWHGGTALPAVDHFTGAPLAIEHIPAEVLEHQAYGRLRDGVIDAVGEPPLGMTGDRAQSIKEVFELNTRAGIASVIPWRIWNAGMTREDVRCDLYDEHGVPRCRHCGGPCDQASRGLGLYFDARGEPRIRFRCMLVHGPECKRTQSIACETDWRMLLPLGRLTELYHALRHSHQSFEHVHRHWRDRYSVAGKNLESRLKRRGLPAQQLRSDAALVIEWFRLCLRHGWLGSARRGNGGELRKTNGLPPLARLSDARKKRRLDRPYGPAAVKLGLARAGPAP
jgi:hypothetical protein